MAGGMTREVIAVAPRECGVIDSVSGGLEEGRRLSSTCTKSQTPEPWRG